MTVLIAGAGIAGLTLGLTLHQIGVPFRIFEAVRQLRPLGVGINLQPNAVRELMDLGLGPDLEKTGVQTRTLGFYTRTGRLIWQEPRGVDAGYRWPQMSVHRGHLQMMLYDALVRRAGKDAVVTGHRATGYVNTRSGPELVLDGPGGVIRQTGDLLVAADGIHSAIRAQMYPEEGPPVWGGAILWRGTTSAPGFSDVPGMILAGHDTRRFVAYPISAADPATGNTLINWIAERRVDPATQWRREDWNRPADLNDFLPEFESWKFDWLDVPGLIRGAEAVYEYPMVDRDPVNSWTDGAVTLMGDAAHPTYPVGSNGASQAIVDARVIGAKLAEHGATPGALQEYEAQMRPRANAVVLANRGSGPDAILQRVEDLCGGEFDQIDDVIPTAELAAHSARYKKLAGFDPETLNIQPPLVPAALRKVTP
ncbi:flavin-dependent oxidoreductase [uncultured Roseobacter sp.]|uniref:flavin-dependent oxidoreductase n=1 Tax=uncultured Roseobacter sp. TaxID=114847 RepID=UPI002621948B|nr:flavin-dependent oxidoreductase [uncultured Roseobacter sp.]